MQAHRRQAHRTVYDNALRMIHSEAATAFDLSQEPAKVRDAYGKGVFGQGCLLARRLVEHGVPFVEVSLTSSSAGSFGWDTHANNFEAVKALSAELDAGWASLHERSCGSRPVGIDDDRVDGRVRPHAANQRPGRPRSFSAGVVVRAWRRRHRGRPGLRPHQRPMAWISKRTKLDVTDVSGDVVFGAGRATRNGEQLEHGPANQDC